MATESLKPGNLPGSAPVAGDVISSVVSSYLIWKAQQLGAPRWLIARMMARRMEKRGLGRTAGPIIEGEAVRAR